MTAVESSSVWFRTHDRLFQNVGAYFSKSEDETDNKTKRLDNNKKIFRKDKTKINFSVGNGLLFCCHYITDTYFPV